MVSRASHSHHVPHVGLPPQRTDDQHQRREHHANFGRRAREQVPGGAPRLGNQPQDRCNRSDPEREIREPRGRHVEIQEANRFLALVLARRRDRDREVHREGERDERHGDEQLFHASSSSGPNATSPAATTSTANAHSNCTHGHASPGELSSAAFECTRRAQHHRRDRRQDQQGNKCLARTESAGQHAVDRTGGCESDGRGHRRANENHNATNGHVVQHDHRNAEQHFEQEQLDRDRGGLAQEDRAAVESGEPQPVARPVRILDGERSADGEQRLRAGPSPRTGRAQPGEEGRVGVECEREQHHDDPPERKDLLDRDARPALDPQVLARDQQGGSEEGHIFTADRLVS